MTRKLCDDLLPTADATPSFPVSTAAAPVPGPAGAAHGARGVPGAPGGRRLVGAGEGRGRA